MPYGFKIGESPQAINSALQTSCWSTESHKLIPDYPECEHTTDQPPMQLRRRYQKRRVGELQEYILSNIMQQQTPQNIPECFESNPKYEKDRITVVCSEHFERCVCHLRAALFLFPGVFLRCLKFSSVYGQLKLSGSTKLSGSQNSPPCCILFTRLCGVHVSSQVAPIPPCQRVFRLFG